MKLHSMNGYATRQKSSDNCTLLDCYCAYNPHTREWIQLCDEHWKEWREHHECRQRNMKEQA